MRVLAFLVFLLSSQLPAQDIAGRWITIDDATHKPGSIVEIALRDGKAYGHIVKLFRDPGEDPDPVCDKCDTDDDRYNKKVLGMEIIRGMVKDGDAWEDGTILDPKNGSVYDCKLWIENGNLRVRGYVMFFFRTQTWVREKS